MMYENEQAAKLAEQVKYQQDRAYMQSQSTTTNNCPPQAAQARYTLRDRVESHLNASYAASHRVNRLEELSSLLQKNPDVARILDLLEEVQI